MYCQKCGEKIIEIEGARFCRRCGQPVETQRENKKTTQYEATQQKQRNEVNQRTDIRQQETAELQKMIRYFSQKSDQYREYDRLAYRMIPKNRNAPTSFLIWGLVCAVIGAILFSFFSGSFSSLTSMRASIINRKNPANCLSVIPIAFPPISACLN